MSMLELLFFLMGLTQVAIISLYFPMKVRRRVEYVLTHHPPDTHPKLYPPLGGLDPLVTARRLITAYWYSHVAIALIGVGLVTTAAVTGYELGPKGGAEKWVIAYFFLQMLPHFAAEMSTFGLLKLMRRAASSGLRRATLQPRRLSDFVSPAAVVAALLLYAAWMVIYLYHRGDEPWGTKVYVTLTMVTAGHLFFWFVINRTLYGKRQDPHQTDEDRARRMVGAIKIALTSSIMVSVFLIVTDVVRAHQLGRLDPLLTSLYLQVMIAFSYRVACGAAPLESTDFRVYQENAASA